MNKIPSTEIKKPILQHILMICDNLHIQVRKHDNNYVTIRPFYAGDEMLIGVGYDEAGLLFVGTMIFKKCTGKNFDFNQALSEPNAFETITKRLSEFVEYQRQETNNGKIR